MARSHAATRNNTHPELDELADEADILNAVVDLTRCPLAEVVPAEQPVVGEGGRIVLRWRESYGRHEVSDE